jgi:hypothetical protein
LKVFNNLAYELQRERYMTRKAFLLFILLNLTYLSFSQNADITKVSGHFGGAVSVTTKGISTIPNLTLGKPAAIFDLYIAKKNLSFEPQLRFALEGKPWSFLFWWRYKVIQTGKIRLNIGAHPALSFKNKTSYVDGVTTENMVVYRYLAGELSPVYFLSQNISIGSYYLYSRGIEKEITKNTNLIALRSNFSNIKLSTQLYVGFFPQAYYLKMDEHEGFYFNSSITLGKKNLPFSLSAMVNKRLRSNIPADNDFIWNVSLRYSFNKEYIEK